MSWGEFGAKVMALQAMGDAGIAPTTVVQWSYVKSVLPAQSSSHGSLAAVSIA